MAPDDTRSSTPLRDVDLERTPQPPSNLEAEQGLLGAILVNNTAYGRVSEFLAPEHFVNEVHGRIFAAMRKLIERGEVANFVTLKNLFDQDGALSEIGGAQYLARLAESVVTIINAEHYGRTIHDLHLRRELITIGQDVVTDAFRHDLDNPAATQIERAEQKLYTLATLGQTNGAPKPIADAIDAALETAGRTFKANGRVTGITTGLTDLNKKLGGLHPSDLIIIAGATSMGKTTLSLVIAYAAARAGIQVYFASQEMSAEQISQKLLATWTGISVERQRAGPLSQADINALLEARLALRSLPLTIDEKTRSVVQLRSRVIRHKRRFGLGLIIDDYLQLLHSDRTRPENRVQEVSAITQALKAIAMELNVPVVALSQLSRGIEQRDDKRPHLSDLRDSGSIEQDADQVLFPFREAYYLAREEPRQGRKENADAFNKRLADWKQKLADTEDLAEIIIAKNRHGSFPHTVPVHFDGDRSRFYDLTTRTPDDR